MVPRTAGVLHGVAVMITMAGMQTNSSPPVSPTPLSFATTAGPGDAVDGLTSPPLDRDHRHPDSVARRLDESMAATGSPAAIRRIRAPMSGSIEDACLEQPRAMKAATGCTDPQTAMDLIAAASNGMPGQYHPKPSGPCHKTAPSCFDNLVPLAHELRNADADEGLLALSIARTEAWTNRLLDVAGVVDFPSREQERVLRLALKFQAMTTRQIEVLHRIKSGGVQVVRVERVEIHGGQNIVGAISGTGPGPASHRGPGGVAR